MNQLLSNPSRLLSHHCLCPTVLQIVFLFSGSDKPGPGSHQDSVFVGPSPAMFLLTINLCVFVPFFFLSIAQDFSSSEKHSQTTQLVWPLSLYRIALIYVLCMILYFCLLSYQQNLSSREQQPFYIFVWVIKKKVALILMHFENVLFSTEHVYLVMHGKVLSISWQKIIESMNNGIQEITQSYHFVLQLKMLN